MEDARTIELYWRRTEDTAAMRTGDPASARCHAGNGGIRRQGEGMGGLGDGL